MAAKSTTKTETVPANTAPTVDRAQLVATVAHGLLQSPRYASRITDEAQQDLLVACAVKIAGKIAAATANL